MPPAKEGMPDVTLPPRLHPRTIRTMHSLGWMIIGENADRLGMRRGCRLLPMHLRQVLFDDAARLCGEDGSFGRQCADRKSKLGEPADEKERQVFDRDPFRVGLAVFDKVLNPAGQPRGLAAAGSRHQCDGSGEDQCCVLVAFGHAHGATFDCPCQPRRVTGWPPTGNYHVRVHPQMWWRLEIQSGSPARPEGPSGGMFRVAGIGLVVSLGTPIG